LKSIFDVSLTLSWQVPVWPGEGKVNIQKTRDISKGDVCNVSSFSMSMHTGTHVDMPKHFIDGGKSTEDIDLNKFMGRAKVFEFDKLVDIDEEDLKNLDIDEDDIVILKIKKNGELLRQKEFFKDYVSISEDAASFLVDRRVKGVGINYFSIEKYESDTFPVHRILLENEIVIIEGLNLEEVQHGLYDIFCLPLKFENGNGSPVRAVLVKY